MNEELSPEETARALDEIRRGMEEGGVQFDAAQQLMTQGYQ